MSCMTIEIKGFGPVLFQKCKRRKTTLSIAVKSPDTLKILIPSRISFNKAKDIVLSKLNWLRKSHEKIKYLKKEHASKIVDVSHLRVIDMKQKLINRTHQLACEYGFKYNKITIRKQKTRWGSCSGSNNISLNIKLIHLPDYLIDYVILHELLHTRIKNHSRIFWNELSKLLPRAKAFKKLVNTFHLVLM